MQSGYLYLTLNILLTVYSQIVLKWQINLHGEFPEELTDKIRFLFSFVLNPWVISSIVAVGLASVTWILTLSKFDLSYAYPFTVLSYILVVALSYFIFLENISKFKFLGITLILLGVLLISKK